MIRIRFLRRIGERGGASGEPEQFAPCSLCVLRSLRTDGLGAVASIPCRTPRAVQSTRRRGNGTRRTLLLALLCAAAVVLLAGGALAQEGPGTKQYSESGYCVKKLGPKDAPFASPSVKGEWEYDAINACIDARRQEEAADPAPCSEVPGTAYRFDADRVEACRGQQYGTEPPPTEQEGDGLLVDDPESYPCTEVVGSPESATGLASNGTVRTFGEERVDECMGELEAEAASPDPCSGPLFFDTFAELSTASLAGPFGNLADPALVDPDGNGLICGSGEPAAQEGKQYEEPLVEDPEAVSCAEVLGPRPAPRMQGPAQEADLVAPGQEELYGEDRVQACLEQLRTETGAFADPTTKDYGVCSQPLFAELYTGLSTDYLYALGGGDVLNEMPADPDGNGIICDSWEPADRLQYEEPPVAEPQAVPCTQVMGDPRGAGGIIHGYQILEFGQERVDECVGALEAEAVSPDPCSGPLFFDTFGGLPTRYFAGYPDLTPDPALVDPDGNGIACDPTKPREMAPEEDPCAEPSFAERYAGRPVAEAPNPEDPAVDPDGTGVTCGHVLAEHGYVPLGGEPETGRVLPLTGGPAGVAPSVAIVLLLGLTVFGALALGAAVHDR